MKKINCVRTKSMNNSFLNVNIPWIYLALGYIVLFLSAIRRNTTLLQNTYLLHQYRIREYTKLIDIVRRTS